MGKDKIRRFEENKHFSNLIQSSFEEAFQKDHPMKGKWSQQLFHNDHPLILELGCGKGEYTLALARQFPDNNYIGVDIKGARLWRGAKTAMEEPVPNAAFLRTRIEFIESFFALGEVAQLWITFPDPQPIKPNKRLTSPRFLNRYLSFLRPDAVIHLKTDSLELHQYTIQVFESKPDEFEFVAVCADIYGSGFVQDNPLLAVKTHYESQFLKQGKPITYLQVQSKNPSKWTGEVC